MREYELQSAFDLVTRRMSLRRPLLSSVRKFHEAMKRLPQKLQEMEPNEAYSYFRESFPEFPPAGKLELTCALATGVGKTRLIGAFMAYLHLADEAHRFLIMAPRTTIVDKIVRETAPGDRKYIFVDEFLVGEPQVIHAGNFRSFNPAQQRLSQGPEIWVFSPQSIAGNDQLRFKAPTEFLGLSPYEYLSKASDLIVFFDESHYLGDDENGRGAWMAAIRALKPKLLVEMTGSPRPGVNVIHEYDLKEALEEGLYIKDVQVFPKTRPTSLTNEEWDRVTLRDGLKRLRIKEEAIRRRSEDTGIPLIKPVMLVCAETQEHADSIASWIKTELKPDEIAISVHSGRNEDEYIDQLLDVENNDVKVVVHVFKLTEGWDVSNVYVIATLRALATVRGVIQTMGRGLRLPYGSRISDEEVDSLDLMCYGSQTSQEIVDGLINDGYGGGGAGRKLIGVRNDIEDSRSREPSKVISFNPLRVCEVRFMPFGLKSQKPDISVLNLPLRAVDTMRSIGLRDLQIRERGSDVSGVERDRFVAIVVDGVLRLCRNLGGLSDRSAVEAVVDRMLNQAGLASAADIPIDIDMATRQLAELIKRETRRLEPEYVLTGPAKPYVVGKLSYNVPVSYSQPLSASSITSATWQRSIHAGFPINGWVKCAHEAIPFDSAGELAAAKALDHSYAVEWWARNLPSSFVLPTPAGNYAPDFLLVCRLEEGDQVLLEIKGEFLVGGEESEANLRAKAARAWCDAMTKSGSPWQYWLVLDRDAQRCQTVEDLKNAAES